MTERPENEVKRASDENDDGKLHNKERDGFNERVFAWPDAIFGGYIQNDTCIGHISIVLIYICDHFFPQAWLLEQTHPRPHHRESFSCGLELGRKEIENRTGVR